MNNTYSVFAMFIQSLIHDSWQIFPQQKVATIGGLLNISNIGSKQIQHAKYFILKRIEIKQNKMNLLFLIYFQLAIFSASECIPKTVGSIRIKFLSPAEENVKT